MNKKQIRFIGFCFFIWLIALTCAMGGCSSIPASAPDSTSKPTASAAAIASPNPAPGLSSIAITPASPVNTSTQPPQNVVVIMPSFADLLNVVNPSVVEIDTSGTAVTNRGRVVRQEGAGSGWIMDANGTIVTNNHVIEGATTITVTTYDGKTFPAQVINTDPANDLALIKIDATQLQSIKIGDASKLRTGDWVLAIGNLLGEGIIATQGIVSRLGVNATVSSTQTYINLIETTAAINPGNSGGPLINMSGEVIGITSLGVSAVGIQGMGYAISMVDALPEIQKLIR
jgi:serine protease Do